MIKVSLEPVEYKVIVKPLDIETKSESGIILSVGEESKKLQWAQTRAILVDVGGNSFEGWNDPKPIPGDEVMIRQYTGYKVEDPVSKEEFQVCNDKDISLIVKRNVEEIVKIEECSHE